MKRWPFLPTLLTWALLGVCIWQVRSFRSALEIRGDARSMVRISYKAANGETVDHNATLGINEDPFQFAARRAIEVQAMKVAFPPEE